MSVVAYEPRRGVVRNLAYLAAAEVGRAVVPQARQAITEAASQAGRYIFKAMRRGTKSKRKTKKHQPSSKGGGGSGGGGRGGYVSKKSRRKRAGKSKGSKRTTKKKVSKKPKLLTNKYRAYGWQATYDFHETFTPVATDPNHVGVASGTPASSMLFTICGAIWRRLYGMAGGDIRNPNDNTNIGAFSITITYRLGRDDNLITTNGTITFSVSTSHGAVIAEIRDRLCIISTSSMEKLYLYQIQIDYNTGVGAGFRKKMSLENAKIDVLMYNNMSLQNRTLGAAATDNEATDVTANPLKYYHWKTRSNGFDLCSGYTGGRGETVDGYGGILTLEDYPNAAQPLRKLDIKRSVMFTTGIIGPGAIRTFTWKYSKTMELDALLWKFSDFMRESNPPTVPPDSVFAMVHLGFTNYIQFEKVIRSGDQKMQIGVDNSTTCGARIYPGRNPVLNLLKYVT